jgi:hypothetical protein
MSDDKPAAGFVSLGTLKGAAPKSPPEILAEIRRIYFKTTKQTVLNDLAHAIELLKSLPDEESRQKAHVYMEGIAQMRNEWIKREGKGQRAKGKGQGKGAKEEGKGAKEEGKGPKAKGEGPKAKGEGTEPGNPE